MKTGDLIRVVKNDMSIVMKVNGPKDKMFFDQVGTIVKVYDRDEWTTLFSWFKVLLPTGLYEARQDAIEVVSEEG